MKKIHVLAIAAALFFAGAATAVFAEDIFTCIGAPGGPVYVVTQDGSNPEYFLVKRQLVSGGKIKELARAPINKPVMFNEVFITTTDLGRGGYAHIYVRGDEVSLIDVNVFDVPRINTDGLLEGYDCSYCDLR
jgi:hypothetical protein